MGRSEAVICRRARSAGVLGAGTRQSYQHAMDGSNSTGVSGA
jgi:hypothetical protein